MANRKICLVPNCKVNDLSTIVEESKEKEAVPDQLTKQLSTLSVSKLEVEKNFNDLDLADLVVIPEEEKSKEFPGTMNSVPRNVCRLCAKMKSDGIKIFPEPDDENFGEVSLIEKIHYYLPIKIKEDDDLPKIICFDCFKLLNTFHELAITCQSTEKQLKDPLQIKELSIEIVDVVTIEINKSKGASNKLSQGQNELLRTPFYNKSVLGEQNNSESAERYSQDTISDEEGIIFHSSPLVTSDEEEPFTFFEGLKKLKNSEKRHLWELEEERPRKMRRVESSFEQW